MATPSLRKRLLQYAWVLFLAFTSGMAQAQTYAAASNIGPAKGLADIGCRGGFVDIKGNCWKCPDGFKHDNFLLPPTDGKVCKDEGGRDNREGTRHAAGSGLLKTDCPRGQWLSTHNGSCYSCPNGFNHDILKKGNQDGVCWRDKKDQFAAASRMTGTAFCEKNAFFDPIKGGTCWACPAATPNRNIAQAVDSANACVSASCGADGGRPCLITERIPSCNTGLVEDIASNQCVTDVVAFQVCKATINSIKAGQVPPQLRPIMAELSRRTKAVTPAELENLKNNGFAFVEKNQSGVPEIRKILDLMKQQLETMGELFDADTLCSPPKLLKMVEGPAKALVTPTYKGNPFGATTLVVSVADAVGVQAGLTLAIGMDLAKPGELGPTGLPTIRQMGLFGWVGPQLVSNATAGISRGHQLYPMAQLCDFEGFGWGVSASVGIPTLKVVSGGVDISFGESLLPVGFGASMGVGVGVLPADVAIGASYSWPIWSTQDIKKDVVRVFKDVNRVAPCKR